MSKYTTEVRYICEQKSGLTDSLGASGVDKIIYESWDKIFTTTCEFFDESYRRVLCSKILKHYYLREIGAETVGVWLLWMNTKLEEVMPYYNKLYESARVKYDYMYSTDVYTRHEGKDSNVGGTESDSSGEEWNKFSDTPQGGVAGLESDTYLTNATKVSGNTKNVSSQKYDNTDEYLNHTYGFSNNPSKLLMEYRETIINIDMMVIKEFGELFMNLW